MRKDDSNAGSAALCTTPDGAVKVNAVIGNETLWLAQAAMAELFGAAPQNIAHHLKRIYSGGAPHESAARKEVLQVQDETLPGTLGGSVAHAADPAGTTSSYGAPEVNGLAKETL